MNVTEEQIKAARVANLYSFLAQYHASDIIIEYGSIRLISNHSISIKKGYCGYCDFATGETGNSVDLLVRYLGYSFPDAVLALCENNSPACSTPASCSGYITGRDIELPKPFNGQYRQLYAYLMSRGIDSKIIDDLVQKKLLYQSDYMNNAVFLNTEKDWAELRGMTAKPFHRIATASRSDGFWCLHSENGSDTAYVCESAIDAISLYQIHIGKKIDTGNYISIGGVSKQSAINRIKRDFTAILAVDNDNAGQICRDKNPELDFILPVHKDWNEDLLIEPVR